MPAATSSPWSEPSLFHTVLGRLPPDRVWVPVSSLPLALEALLRLQAEFMRGCPAGQAEESDQI